jgi:membrane-associated phospholipid phosphatase
MHGFTFNRGPIAVALLALAFGLGGCATRQPTDWGAEATWAPARATLVDAALDAAKSPRVWLPLVGAAVFQIDGWDRRVSNYARENTPIFGSQRAAQEWSDRLRTASSVAYFATVLATPGPDEPGPWMRDKARGLAVGLGAIAVTGLATTGLKKASARTRPNGEGHESFPSGHTSHSAVLTGLARDNLDYLDIGDGTRRTLDIGLDALTIGTGWARVEAGAHFPSDVLVGMALGNFVSRVFDRAFLENGSASALALNVEPLPRGVELQWRVRF